MTNIILERCIANISYQREFLNNTKRKERSYSFKKKTWKLKTSTYKIYNKEQSMTLLAEKLKWKIQSLHLFPRSKYVHTVECAFRGKEAITKLKVLDTSADKEKKTGRPTRTTLLIQVSRDFEQVKMKRLKSCSARCSSWCIISARAGTPFSWQSILRSIHSQSFDRAVHHPYPDLRSSPVYVRLTTCADKRSGDRGNQNLA